jgi:hypothetical protein
MGLKSVAGGWMTNAKFVAVPQHNMFVLSDIRYWADREQELDEWCSKNFCVRKGMTVTALNEFGYILFGLRWS